MSWKMSNETPTRGYKFSYDNLSRLTAANYLENGSTNDHFNTAYAYDKQGNMTSLSRRGNTGTTTYGNIDVLTMTYAGNQLVKAEDSGTTVSLSSSMDFKNGSRRMQAKICATVLAQLCHRTGTTLPTHWHNRAIAVAQTYSFYSGKSLFVLP